MHRLLVSVVIPSYNHAPYVEATIDSILAQTVSDLELIIIDDGSKDNSVEVIQRKLDRNGDRRARLIARENRGLCRTLNEGLGMAQGAYFAYLGSDDLWEPTKLEKQISAMEAEGRNVGASFTDCYAIDTQGRRFNRLGRHNPYRGGDIYPDLIWCRFQPPSPTNLFVRQKLILAGGFNESVPIEDYDAWLRLARHYRVAYVPEALASFRVHQTNTSMAYPQRMISSLIPARDWAFRIDPTLRVRRRLIEGRHHATYAQMCYYASDLRRARQEALRSLRAYPFDRMAWRTLALSLLGSSWIERLRHYRRARSRS